MQLQRLAVRYDPYVKGLTFATTVRGVGQGTYRTCGKTRVSKHDVVLRSKYQWPAFSFFVYNKRTVKFMHSSNHTEHYRGEKCIIAHSENTTALQSNVFFNWNTSVIGHKQWTFVFTQRKTLPGSNANSTVSNSNSGALSALLFRVNSFTLTNCSNFSTKKMYPLGTLEVSCGGRPL